MTINRRRRWPKHANSCSFFCRFNSASCLLWANGWDLSQLNQGLKFFPLCRQDYPLPPPINKGGCHGLREEQIESKISQKTSFSGFCTVLSLLSLHRGLQPPPPSSPVFPPLPPPQEANITTNRLPRATVGFSLLFAAPPIFFLFFCFLCYQPPSLPQPQPPSSRQPLTISTTSSHLNYSPTAKHTPSVPLSLLQIFFFFFLLALPLATSSNYWSHHRTTSSVYIRCTGGVVSSPCTTSPLPRLSQTIGS